MHIKIYIHTLSLYKFVLMPLFSTFLSLRFCGLNLHSPKRFRSNNRKSLRDVLLKINENNIQVQRYCYYIMVNDGKNTIFLQSNTDAHYQTLRTLEQTKRVDWYPNLPTAKAAQPQNIKPYHRRVNT